MKVRMFYITNI